MNWFKLISVFVQLGATISGVFVKNPESKKTAETVIGLVSTVVEGLANSNPDGTPATQPYAGPPAKINVGQ